MRRESRVESIVSRGQLRRTRSVACALAAFTAVLFVAGCHNDMWTEPKIHKPLQEEGFFPDGQSARPIVTHTVVHEPVFDTDDALHTGIQNHKLVTTFPFRMTRADLERGQDRFNIYCSPCHGRLGYGDGMIARRGFWIRKHPGNYHTDRLRNIPVGHFYDVITNGFGAMYSYASRIQDPRDRWRIVAYIRVLQASQHATTAQLGPGVDPNSLQPDNDAVAAEQGITR